ncbi:Alpha/Beta hydrolase protein [Mrakia frigida]|uniref:palmitoyl-protein thioesterase family protein n=1 Tax=Mrakia frigida TaxID=29902 RepID=UPI003FCC1074
MLLSSSLALVLLFSVSALPALSSLPSAEDVPSPASSKVNPDLPSSSLPRRRPVVIWHGLGDSAGSEGMLGAKQDVEELFEDIFVHNIFISEDEGDDRKAGFFGNVNEQIALVAEQLAAIPELAEGFSAIGFSQGGQFLRAFVELYNSPPIHTLVTFGSQHMGISDIPTCRPTDFICRLASSTAKRGVYTPYAQRNLVQAQYWRDPNHLDAYLEKNTFLPLINNELPSPTSKNTTYASNLSSLSKLVLLRFTNESTVVPPISSWFGSIAPKSSLTQLASSDSEALSSGAVTDAEEEIEIPMEDQPLYKEDWLGLKVLEESGRLKRGWCAGEHMDIGGCWWAVLGKYFGGFIGDEDERERGGELVVQRQ